MHKVFISYHSANDQPYKDALDQMNRIQPVFIDYSVNTGDISDELPDETIRRKIRDEYLRDSTVTILLAGAGTKGRKHVDWELFSSMFDGAVNKKSGILIITLPTTGCIYSTATHNSEREVVYSDITSWETWTRSEYGARYPFLPDRIIDNLVKSEARISITNWHRIYQHWDILGFLINATHNERVICEYDLARPMKRANS